MTSEERNSRRMVRFGSKRLVGWLLSGATIVAGLSQFPDIAFGQDTDEAQWSQLDMNQDGRLTGTEIKGGWDRYDSDGDNKVTKLEFLAGRKRDSTTGSKATQSKRDKFNELDITGNGYLTGKELESLDVAAIDLNRDSVISLEEYLASSADSPPQPTVPGKTLFNPNRILTPSKNESGTNRIPAATQPASPKNELPPKASQPILGKVVQGKPVGFFYMSKRWIATGYTENATWYFTPSGNVYVNVTTGFSEVELKQHTGVHGTFTVSEKTMNVQWSDGSSSNDELEYTETGFYWETGSYLPIAAFRKGSIAGVYSGGTSSTFSGTNAIVGKTLRLESNGNYTLDGAASLSSQDGPNGRIDRSTPITGGSSATAGKWKQDGFFLTLSSNAGESQRYLIFPFDDAETTTYPDRLYMASVMFKKE